MTEETINVLIGSILGALVFYILADVSYKQGKSGGKIRDDYDPTELGADKKDYLNPEFDDSEDEDAIIKRITKGALIHIVVFTSIVWFFYETSSLGSGVILFFVIAFLATLPPYLAGGFVAVGFAKNKKIRKK